MYNNISAEIAKLGMTRGQFADFMGVSRPTLRRWIGEGDIPSNKLIEMTTLFRCSADYLLKSYKPRILAQGKKAASKYQ